MPRFVRSGNPASGSSGPPRCRSGARDHPGHRAPQPHGSAPPDLTPGLPGAVHGELLGRRPTLSDPWVPSRSGYSRIAKSRVSSRCAANPRRRHGQGSQCPGATAAEDRCPSNTAASGPDRRPRISGVPLARHPRPRFPVSPAALDQRSREILSPVVAAAPVPGRRTRGPAAICVPSPERARCRPPHFRPRARQARLPNLRHHRKPLPSPGAIGERHSAKSHCSADRHGPGQPAAWRADPADQS